MAKHGANIAVDLIADVVPSAPEVVPSAPPATMDLEAPLLPKMKKPAVADRPPPSKQDISNKIFELLKRGNPELLSRLLANSFCTIDVLSMPNEDGDTPLHVAVRTKNIKLVNAILRAKGFSKNLIYNFKNNDSKSAWDLAIANNMCAILETYSPDEIPTTNEQQKSEHPDVQPSAQAVRAVTDKALLSEPMDAVALDMIEKAESQTAAVAHDPTSWERLDEYHRYIVEIQNTNRSWVKAMVAAMFMVLLAALTVFLFAFGLASYGTIAIPIAFSIIGLKIVESAVVGGIIIGAIAPLTALMSVGLGIFSCQTLIPSKEKVTVAHTTQPPMMLVP